MNHPRKVKFVHHSQRTSYEKVRIWALSAQMVEISTSRWIFSAHKGGISLSAGDVYIRLCVIITSHNHFWWNAAHFYQIAKNHFSVKGGGQFAGELECDIHRFKLEIHTNYDHSTVWHNRSQNTCGAILQKRFRRIGSDSAETVAILQNP